MPQYDTLIVGAGPAGLSAALILGRCLRTVIVCGAGETRNVSAHAVHGLLGQEGKCPADLIADAKRDVSRYPTVEICEDEVVAVVPDASGFAFETASGAQGQAKKVLLATGLRDELPEIDGIEALYGRSVHHCLYCDGYEYAKKPLAAYGREHRGLGLALMISHWSDNVLLLTNGPSNLDDAARAQLAANNIPIVENRIVGIEAVGAEGCRIKFENELSIERAGLFFSTGCRQKSDLWQSLGCLRDEKGGIITDPLTEETSTPGVYVAGDVSRDVLLVAVAVAEGAKAAVAINRALLREAGLI